ncbi:MAG: DUF6268 family outer membrane beta-barrel protein [Bacteroidia bacterium]|nr:DUF6268 family outer membrane beta-barrel protein [Bacteroidia bacterium]
MMLKRYSVHITRTWCAALLALSCSSLHAQVDTTGGAADDEDYGQYDNVGFADDGAKRFCSPKIEGLSPAKLISVGYDYQMGYQMIADSLRSQSPFAPWGNFNPDTGEVAYSHGLRLACNIPVVSKTSLVWQLGANYWEQKYEFKDGNSLSNPMLTALRDNGLRTMGINTTVFKPLNDKQFLLFQGSVDMSGDFQLSKLMPARYLKYSAAAIWGKRPTERKQWGIGVSRTYRVGEMNYIPIVLFNWTDASNKWGTEILFPARAHVRRTINSRNMVFAGYELEGQSYRLYRNNEPSANFDMRREDLEIRRGEIRVRLMYEFSLKGFVWMSVQAGYRINYRYDVDRLADGAEIYRGFGLVNDAPYVMVNQLTNPLYFTISLNLVSP